MVCEVKEIRPNVEDKAFDEKLKKHRYAHIIRRPLGKRAGAKLEDARGQLRRFQDDPRPCILVILDKTFHSYLTPGEIDAAMFGDPLALFSTNPVDHSIEFTRGGNRRLREEREIYIGALAVLGNIESEGGIRLDIYHNPFTSKSISPAYFPDLQDRHYVKKGDPNAIGHEWQEYLGPRNDA